MATQDASKKMDLEFQLEEVEEVKDQSSLLEEDIADSLIVTPDSKKSAIPDPDEFELEIIAKPEKSSAPKIKAPEPKEKTAAPLLELGEEELAEATRINSTQMLQDLPDLSAMSDDVQKEQAPAPDQHNNPNINNNLLEQDPFSLDDPEEAEQISPVISSNEVLPESELEKLSEETNPVSIETHSIMAEENATTVLKFPSEDLPAKAPAFFEEKDNPSLESLIEEQEEKFNLNGPSESEKFPETFKVSLPTTVAESTSGAPEENVHPVDPISQADQFKEEIEELPPSPPIPVHNNTSRKEIIKSPIKESVHYEYDENEMLKLQSTIRHLREERDLLTHEGERAQEIVRSLEKDKLSYKAELDELKIENSILKKRHANQIREMSSELSMALEKKAIYEARVKQYQLEIQRLNERVVIDVNKVRSKEKELEGHLEILTMDSASQIQSRDQKIRELKRKIDTLEFNMNNAIVSEKKWRDDRVCLEEKLHKVIKSLKDTLKNIEEDVSLDISVHELPRKKA